MNADEIRLECLKLAHRHDRSPEAVVETAKVYEAFVANSSSRVLPVNPKAGNSGKRVG